MLNRWGNKVLSLWVKKLCNKIPGNHISEVLMKYDTGIET